MSSHLDDILVKTNIVSDEKLQQALEHQRTNGGRLGAALVKLGFISEDQVTAALAARYGVPAVDLARIQVDAAVIRLVPADAARKHKVLPVQRIGATLKLAMTDPSDMLALDDIRFMTGLNVEPVLASETGILEAIERHHGAVEEDERKKQLEGLVGFIDADQTESVELEETEDGSLNLAALEKAAEEAPVIRLVNYILMDAVKRGASDVHLEPYERDYRVRFRVYGILQ